MEERSFKRLLRRTVAVPVILLMLLAATLVGEILLLSFSLRWVDHSDQVISNARQMMRYMVEMDTGQRGYHLTGDRTFLDGYGDARSKFPEQSDLLGRMTADNPDQQRRLRYLHDLDSRWIQWSDQLLKQAPGKSPSPQDLLAGQQLMTDIRAEQRDFIGAEEILRKGRAQRASLLNALVIASAILLSLVIAVLLFTLTRRELGQLSASYEGHLRAEEEKTQEAKESRELFQITLRSLGEAAIATDATGRVSLINPVAQQITGWSEKDAIGRSLREVLVLIDDRTRGEVEDVVERIRKTGEMAALTGHVVLLGRGGQESPVELSGAPILNDFGKLMGVVVLFRDIQQRLMTEQTLRSNERLTLAGRLSATIAHEIRNPLDTVTNLVYLLQHEPNQSQATSQFLSMANDELARITQITSQLLTFHREARSPVEVDLVEVLDSVLTLFAPQIRKNHIQVDQRFETQSPVRGYPGELRQVFSNLVGNAIDAMPKGGKLTLHVRESSLSSDPQRRGVRITILDSGSGIPPGVRKNLFAPFYTTKGEKGTGLGLWVSRGFVEKHEGTIHVSSIVRPGRTGTLFSVFLPFEQRLGMLDVPEVPPAA